VPVAVRRDILVQRGDPRRALGALLAQAGHEVHAEPLAVQVVVVQTAVDGVVAVLTPDPVVAGLAVQRVVAGAAVLATGLGLAESSADVGTAALANRLVPGDGDTYFLPRLTGTAKALELLWTADFIEAPKALELGIVNRVVAADKLAEETYALAHQIADGPQIPIRMIKRLVYQSMRLDLRTHLDLVSSHMGLVRQTADHKEGVQAFKDKRPPKFTGR